MPWAGVAPLTPASSTVPTAGKTARLLLSAPALRAVGDGGSSAPRAMRRAWHFEGCSWTSRPPLGSRASLAALLAAVVPALAVVVTVLACTAGAYLVWQHPRAGEPFAAALAVCGLVVGLVGLAVAVVTYLRSR